MTDREFLAKLLPSWPLSAVYEMTDNDVTVFWIFNHRKCRLTLPIGLIEPTMKQIKLHLEGGPLPKIPAFATKMNGSERRTWQHVVHENMHDRWSFSVAMSSRRSHGPKYGPWISEYEIWMSGPSDVLRCSVFEGLIESDLETRLIA